MIRLSKRERYETSVRAALAAIFWGAGEGDAAVKVADGIKDRYSEHWQGIIDEGIELGNSADLTAAIISTIFYRDLIDHELPEDQLLEIRNAIISGNHESRPGLLEKLVWSTVTFSGKNNPNINEDQAVLWIRDIHRALFDDDDTHLSATIEYLLKGASELRGEYKKLISD